MILSVDQTHYFDEIVNGSRPVAVDFWAEWCGPCASFSPILEQAVDRHPDITFVKVNVDEQTDLANRYQVASIPTLILFRDGRESKRSVGLLSRKQLDDFLS